MGSQASRDHEEYLAKVVADARLVQNGTQRRIESNGLGQSPHSAPQPLQQQSPLIGPQGGHGSAGPAPFFTHPAPNQANSPRCNQNWMSPGQAVPREVMPCPSPSSSTNNSFSNSGIAGQRSGPGSVHAPPMSPQTSFRRGPSSNGPASNQPPSYEVLITLQLSFFIIRVIIFSPM
ncbi:hypothetical protein Ciccas_006578 [Cichlidogyrus casuarinus]|uniref:Uncharacterized protein n=1 Tax=Cichlidogyrus casuarinus TaxID=1844966 RepID=A0ABD2Q5V0_9PLAT